MNAGTTMWQKCEASRRSCAPWAQQVSQALARVTEAAPQHGSREAAYHGRHKTQNKTLKLIYTPELGSHVLQMQIEYGIAARVASQGASRPPTENGPCKGARLGQKEASHV